MTFRGWCAIKPINQTCISRREYAAHITMLHQFRCEVGNGGDVNLQSLEVETVLVVSGCRGCVIIKKIVFDSQRFTTTRVIRVTRGVTRL